MKKQALLALSLVLGISTASYALPFGSCTCPQGDMILKYLGDGVWDMSCSEGKISCKHGE